MPPLCSASSPSSPRPLRFPSISQIPFHHAWFLRSCNDYVHSFLTSYPELALPRNSRVRLSSSPQWSPVMVVSSFLRSENLTSALDSITSHIRDRATLCDGVASHQGHSLSCHAQLTIARCQGFHFLKLHEVVSSSTCSVHLHPPRT